MQSKRAGGGGGGTAGLRWGIQLTSVAAAGALLGAAAAPQIGLSMTIGALIGGLCLGSAAILRRWLRRRDDDRAARR